MSTRTDSSKTDKTAPGSGSRSEAMVIVWVTICSLFILGSAVNDGFSGYLTGIPFAIFLVFAPSTWGRRAVALLFVVACLVLAHVQQRLEIVHPILGSSVQAMVPVDLGESGLAWGDASPTVERVVAKFPKGTRFEVLGLAQGCDEFSASEGLTLRAPQRLGGQEFSVCPFQVDAPGVDSNDPIVRSNRPVQAAWARWLSDACTLVWVAPLELKAWLSGTHS